MNFKRIFQGFKQVLFLPKPYDSRVARVSIPLALLLLTILSYGLLLRKLGYYWDDWPWVWYSHLLGGAGLLDIDQVSRPLAGEILWLGRLVAGFNPLLWQITNLLYRWLSGLALWWALYRLWPGRLEKVTWVAFIFLIYPGFRQQFVSVNTSRHLLPLAIFFVSIGLMVWAVKRFQESVKLSRVGIGLLAASLVLGALAMLSTEYYYGLELIRPLVIFLALESMPNLAVRVKKTILFWLPFLMMMIVIYSWRYAVSPGGNYPITIGEELTSQPIGAFGDVFGTIGNGFLTALILAWRNLFDPGLYIKLGLRIPVIYGFLILLVTSLSWLYLSRFPETRRDPGNRKPFWLTALLLGVFALLVAVLPFLVTGLKVGLNFPFDRALLPMMFGSSLVLVALVDALARLRWLKVLVISILVGLSVGMHYLTAVAYQRDWETQRSFYQQLVTRMPGLKPGTTLVYEYSTALENFRSTDNSLIPVLNWIYNPGQEGKGLRYHLADLRLRPEFRASELQKGASISKPYGPFVFQGSTDDLLVIQFAPPWCVNVLAPEFEGLYPNLPENLPRAVAFSNLGQIITKPETPAGLPQEVFGQPGEPGWCDYYQQASLAAQLEDWEAVLRIADRAFALVDPPRQPTERIPFILGYGFTGDWSRAEQLTLDTRRRDANSQELLCEAWKELDASTDPSPEKETILPQMLSKLNCQN